MKKLYNRLLNIYKNMSLVKKSAFWFVICGFTQKSISLMTTPIFSRLLSTSQYGEFSLFVSWRNIILVFTSLNLASGVYLRGLTKFDNDKENFTKSLQLLTLLTTFICFLFYLILHDLFSNLIQLPDIYIYMMFIDIIFCTAFHFWSSYERDAFRYKNLVIVTISNAILSSILGIVMVILAENKVFVRIISIVFVNIIFYLFFLVKNLKNGTKLNLDYWKYALLFNLPLIPHYLSQIVLNQSDRIMINYFCGSDKAGIYSLAYTAAMVMTIVNQSVLNTLSPWMYKKIKSNNILDIIDNSYTLLMLIGFFNILLIAFAPEVISIMAPKSYFEAIYIIPPVACSVFFMFMYSFFSVFEFYYEKTNYVMVASLIGAVLNIFLNYLFIPKVGYLAAGYTTLICYVIYVIMHYFFMKYIIKKHMNIDAIFDTKLLSIISIFFLLLSFLLMLLYANVLIRYMFILCILVIIIIKKDKFINVIKHIK